MKYILSFSRPADQLIHVEIQGVSSSDNPIFQHPKWRPGRYEVQRFDKLFADVQAFDAQAKPLVVTQISTHEYKIEMEKGQAFSLQYHFYANQRDSGGCVYDYNGIYINPCNLFMYQNENFEEECVWQMNIPADYKIACGLKREGNILYAKDFHELADSPLFAANNLLHHKFQVKDLKVHLWFMGECKPDIAKIEADFSAYSEAQIALFGDCPVSEYHYLLLMLPYRYRHGVEHQTSSVNTFGPAYTLMKKDRYESFLELCSHEFFHTWNVKYLRPADMFPYNYSKENYSHLHYVTEGVTSYYGDVMLFKSGLYNIKRFLDNLNFELADHYAMGGKDYISLETASFKSWINGYGADTGIPNRKISFYTKGYLVAFLLDYEIRKASNEVYSLDNVLYDMYQNIAKRDNRGYTKQDYKQTAEKYANGMNLDAFFAQFIEGTSPLTEKLKEAGEYFGLKLNYKPANAPADHLFGLQLAGNMVQNVLPNSPAAAAGMGKFDEIVAINGYKATLAEDLFTYYKEEKEVKVTYFHHEALKEVILQNSAEYRSEIPYFTVEKADEIIEKRRESWMAIKTNLLVAES